MIRGIQASVRGMDTEQARTEALANNIANVDTDGFKRSTVASTEFGAMLVQLVDPAVKETPAIGSVAVGATIAQVLPDNSVGVIQETGNSLDLALTGMGQQFTFQGPNNTLGYTRNGAFHRDAAGDLLTADGYPVLANGQPVGAGAKEIAFRQDGTVLLDGKPAGKLDIRGGNGEPMALKSLERSNVDLATEMTDMIVSLRSFQANQRALAMQDATLARAVNDIGKV